MPNGLHETKASVKTAAVVANIFKSCIAIPLTTWGIGNAQPTVPRWLFISVISGKSPPHSTVTVAPFKSAPAGMASVTCAVFGMRSSGAFSAGTAAVASVFPALSRSTTFDAGASTEPRLCTVTVIFAPSTFTSSAPIPKSGLDQ